MQQADGRRSQRTKMTTDNYTPAYEGPIKQMKEVLRTFNLPQINHVETRFPQSTSSKETNLIIKTLQERRF